MKLYLDDDSAAGLLVRLLRQDGHDVRLPADIGLSGEEDAVHLTHAGRRKATFCSPAITAIS